jgi:hypothetical protein
MSRPGAYATDDDAPGASRAGDDERGEFMREVCHAARAWSNAATCAVEGRADRGHQGRVAR